MKILPLKKRSKKSNTFRCNYYIQDVFFVGNLKKGVRSMNETKYLQRLAQPRGLLVFSIVFWSLMFFVSNFVLAFLQSLLASFQQFQADPKSVSFSNDWRSFLEFQSNWIPFYIGFAILSTIGFVKFIYRIRLNFVDLNKGQHGTSEFEQPRIKEAIQNYPCSRKRI